MTSQIEKKDVASEIKQLVESLQQKISIAKQIGLEVEISTSKLAPNEPISVSIYEKAIF